MQQRIQNKQPSALQGLLLVIGIVALFAALSFVCSVVQAYLNQTLGSVLFWAAGAAVAYAVLREIVMGYQYTYNGMVLRIERIYGSRARFVEDIAVRRLRGMGTLEELKAKFPGAKVVRATRRQCSLPEVAVAYEDGGNVRIALIQPNDEMREVLLRHLKG